MRLLIAMSLVGCSPYPDVVTLSGTLLDERFAGAAAFSNADIEVLDLVGQRFDSTTTSADGRFTVEAPGAADIFAIVSGEGHARASFTGASGIEAEYEVENGSLWGFTEAEMLDWSDRFSGCPGAGEGTLVLGEVRAFGLMDENGEAPIVASAVAEVYDPVSELIYPACYLDQPGEAYLPGADRTGESGIFAVFGAPEGTLVLSLSLIHI